MIRFADNSRVYVSFGVIDFRRGLDGLLSLIEVMFGAMPQDEVLFLFCDRHRKKIKAVYWDGNGFVVLYKRLEVGKFQFPKARAGKIELNRLQLECLLSGMYFIPSVDKKPLKYSVFR